MDLYIQIRLFLTGDPRNISPLSVVWLVSGEAFGRYPRFVDDKGLAVLYIQIFVDDNGVMGLYIQTRLCLDDISARASLCYCSSVWAYLYHCFKDSRLTITHLLSKLSYILIRMSQIAN